MAAASAQHPDKGAQRRQGKHHVAHDRGGGGIVGKAAGNEEVTPEAPIGRPDLPQQLAEGHPVSQARKPLVVQQFQILDPEEDPEDQGVQAQPKGQKRQVFEPQAGDLPRAVSLQRIKDNADQGQGGCHRQIGLIGAHGAGQHRRGKEEAVFVPGDQPHRQHRQQNAEAVGGGREQIEEGVGHRGEHRQQGAAQGAQPQAPDAEQRRRKPGGNCQKQQSEKADDRRGLDVSVPGGCIVQKPAAGDGHLLGVKDPGDPVRVGDNVGKGK